MMRLQRQVGRAWAEARIVIALISVGGAAWSQAASAQNPGLPSPQGARGHVAAPPVGAQAASTPAPAGTLERAEALIRSGEPQPAIGMIRAFLAVDPTNRRARELLAFALESAGDLDEERQVRSALARDYPSDPRIQADYGRVLERSGEESGALRAYRRARALSGGAPAPELDAAIERMKGRTAVEVEAPLDVMSDPDASASRARAGAAIPFGARAHLALLATRTAADARTGPAATTSTALALSVAESGPRVSWAAGPVLSAIRSQGATRTENAAGASIAARAGFGQWLVADGRAEVETPWDEAAVTMLNGGRTTSAEAHLYSHWFSQRLLLQAGARRRRLSILGVEPGASRPRGWQSLWLAGADATIWRSSAAVRGEMLDESMIERTTIGSALTLAYRHYDVTSRTSSDFAAVVALAPAASVDEGSIRGSLALPRGQLGIEADAGLGFDSARWARQRRAGGALTWAPLPAARFALGYEEATESVTGLYGRRRAGWLSVHANL
jgi:tetratricopeptide (TPR) repeat protein